MNKLSIITVANELIVEPGLNLAAAAFQIAAARMHRQSMHIYFPVFNFNAKQTMHARETINL